MNNLDFFDLNNPSDLYEIIHDVYNEYTKEPTEKDFLFLVLGLTHLREWIAGNSWDKIKNKQTLSQSEKFFVDIYKLKSYKIIQELCNRGKHHITQSDDLITSKTFGFNVGAGRCGDSLSQTYFLIDGVDSRDYFIELIHAYNQWFNKNC